MNARTLHSPSPKLFQELFVCRRVFAAKMAAECQGLQADEFSAHPDGAIKGTGF